MGDTSGSGGARSTQYVIISPVGRNDGEIVDIVTPRAGVDEGSLIQQLQAATPRGGRILAFTPESGRRLDRGVIDERLSDLGISATQRQTSGRTAANIRSLIGRQGGATQVGREASGDRRGRQTAARSRRLSNARARQTRIINQANRDGLSTRARNNRLRAANLPTNSGFSIADLNRAGG